MHTLRAPRLALSLLALAGFSAPLFAQEAPPAATPPAAPAASAPDAKATPAASTEPGVLKEGEIFAVAFDRNGNVTRVITLKGAPVGEPCKPPHGKPTARTRVCHAGKAVPATLDTRQLASPVSPPRLSTVNVLKAAQNCYWVWINGAWKYVCVPVSPAP